ncbi:hypothetical protein SAMN05428963_11630 [Consotaella salsifontis]|uniref:Uncharacterized protein n=1 Tax=Consotaella salsifontis TaxID=1365950 RepID=A0A1T4SZ30_9HYPH|nr:hypothetical protein SAMN05428963_11630 [Consotaella salsifontis]
MAAMRHPYRGLVGLMVYRYLTAREFEGTIIRNSLAHLARTFLFMEDSVQKSCWGVTLWTVAAFMAILALAFLFDSVQPIAVAAAG